MHDLSYCRPQFPALSRSGPNNQPLVFLDGPGGSQVPQGVISAITDYYTRHNSNTHGAFVTSQESDQVIHDARTHMATFLGASDPNTISFGQNMTTLNFLLAMALAHTIQPGDEIVVTDLDHDANVAPWLELKSRGAHIRSVPITESGTLDLNYLHQLLTPRTRLVAVGYASNALGTVNPVKQICQWAHEVNALVVVDAVHWAPHGLIDVSDLDPDFLLCSAYKFFGPHVGVLYTKPGLMDHLSTLKVRPQVDTGPEKIETGTLNHASLAGVSAAVDFIASLAATKTLTLRDRIQGAMTNIYAYEHHLLRALYDGLSAIPQVSLYGPPISSEDRAPTISFTVENQDSRQVAKALADCGIMAWDGDFYAIGVVQHLTLDDQGGLVRLGLAPYNTPQEIERTLKAVETIAHG